jgi:hypothetical protein
VTAGLLSGHIVVYGLGSMIDMHVQEGRPYVQVLARIDGLTSDAMYFTCIAPKEARKVNPILYTSGVLLSSIQPKL